MLWNVFLQCLENFSFLTQKVLKISWKSKWWNNKTSFGNLLPLIVIKLEHMMWDENTEQLKFDYLKDTWK